MDYTSSKAVDINPSPKYIYYDFTLSNIDSENYEAQNILTFEENRDTPLINDITDYKMSITRFSLSTWQTPVFYFQAKTNSADPLEGIYSVVLEYTDGVSTVTGNVTRVMFVSQDKSKITPPAPNTFPYGISGHNEFYYIYNYNNFISMINTALETAFTALQALVGAPIATANKPFLVWNDDLTASLLADKDFFNLESAQHIKIFFNRPLYSLFNSFPSYKYFPYSDGKHYQILTEPRDGYNFVTIPSVGAGVYIRIKQEYPCQENWTPIDSIVWTTNMPIVPSAQSNPTIYQNGQQLALSNVYNNSQNIVTDFQTDGNFRSSIFYIPSAEYRYIAFQNNKTPLKNMVMSCYIKDRYGILRPFYLPSNARASMKVLFERIRD